MSLRPPGSRRTVQTCCRRVASSNFFFAHLFPIITCIKHSNTPPSQLAHQAPPPLPRHILDPFPHIFKAFSSRTPWSDSQQGALQPIREVIHTLPHLSYLLYYHPGWPIPRRYPQRPGAQAGYPGPGNAISPPRPPPLQI